MLDVHSGQWGGAKNAPWKLRVLQMQSGENGESKLAISIVTVTVAIAAKIIVS